MKKIYLCFCLLIFGLFYGCSDFLEETSQDEIRPATVEEMEQILLGDAYFSTTSANASNANIYNITDIFTDDIQCNGVGNTTLRERYESRDAMFQWDDVMFTPEGDGDQAAFWQYPYQGIGACNVVLDYLDAMSGDDNLREYVRGEALALRGWYYLHLVNFFGLPYNSSIGSPDQNLGVPLQLTSEVVNESFPRNTVQEVYDQILGDLQRGRRLMLQHPKEGTQDISRVGAIAASAMLSRVYLYLEDWDNVIAYADSVLMEKSSLLDLNTLTDNGFSGAPALSVYNAGNPVEVIWTHGYGGTVYSMVSNAYAKGPWSISDELVDTLLGGATANYVGVNRDVADLRALYYFDWERYDDNSEYYLLSPDKPQSTTFQYGKTQGIRVAEVYLNRAEAYIRKFIEEGNDAYRQQALDDLNFLRQHRYRTDSEEHQVVDIQDGQELLAFCQMERRKELVGETNNRWFDIRRYGLTYDHVVFAHESEQRTVTLNEAQYALPIPQEALNRNSKLIQNER